jgi:hypothetical protein
MKSVKISLSPSENSHPKHFWFKGASVIRPDCTGRIVEFEMDFSLISLSSLPNEKSDGPQAIRNAKVGPRVDGLSLSIDDEQPVKRGVVANRNIAARL